MPFCFPRGGHNGRFVRHAEGRNDPFVSLAAAIMAVLFAMRRVITTLLFPLRNDTWVGKPSGSSSHLPCKAEEFFLRTGK